MNLQEMMNTALSEPFQDKEAVNYEIIAMRAWNIAQQIKRLQEEHGGLIDTLKHESNGVSTTFGTYVLKVDKAKGSVDYGIIPELKGVNLESYRKPMITRYSLIKLGE